MAFYRKGSCAASPDRALDSAETVNFGRGPQAGNVNDEEQNSNILPPRFFACADGGQTAIRLPGQEFDGAHQGVAPSKEQDRCEV